MTAPHVHDRELEGGDRTCNDCGLPIYYCEHFEDYFHENPAVTCWLIRVTHAMSETMEKDRGFNPPVGMEPPGRDEEGKTVEDMYHETQDRLKRLREEFDELYAAHIEAVNDLSAMRHSLEAEKDRRESSDRKLAKMTDMLERVSTHDADAGAPGADTWLAALALVTRYMDRSYKVTATPKNALLEVITVENDAGTEFTDVERAQVYYDTLMGSGLFEQVGLYERPHFEWRLRGQYDDRFWNPDGTPKEGS